MFVLHGDDTVLQQAMVQQHLPNISVWEDCRKEPMHFGWYSSALYHTRCEALVGWRQVWLVLVRQAAIGSQFRGTAATPIRRCWSSLAKRIDNKTRFKLTQKCCASFKSGSTQLGGREFSAQGASCRCRMLLLTGLY